jgi:hypothetical protein
VRRYRHGGVSGSSQLLSPGKDIPECSMPFHCCDMELNRTVWDRSVEMATTPLLIPSVWNVSREVQLVEICACYFTIFYPVLQHQRCVFMISILQSNHINFHICICSSVSC